MYIKQEEGNKRLKNRIMNKCKELKKINEENR